MQGKIFCFFIGTTAELIKIAPVIREFERRKIDFKIIASNQNVLHFEELKPFIHKKSADYTFKLKPFKWPRDIYMRFVVWFVKSLGNYFIYFRNEFREENKKKPLFIVHGDTVTAVIGAIIAKVCGIKLLHIESGLRSFSFLEPFPEEINRFVVSHVADVHFCPNKWSIKNLERTKGVKINTFNNTIGESLALALKNIGSDKLDFLKNTKYFVLVIHRQEHTLFNKRNTKKIIETVIREANNDLKCVFIVHKLTNDYLKKQGLYITVKRNPNVILPSRLPYLKFVNLLKNSEFIATDGGSNQEEAYFLGLPCLILRNRTERIEGLGENAVLAYNQEHLIKDFMRNYKKYARSSVLNFETRPSAIIVDYLLQDKNK